MSSAYPEARFYFKTDKKLAALTIDDSPHPENTQAILEVLDRYEAQATFFIIAGRVKGREAIIEAIISNGHEIGNHMMKDKASIHLEPDTFAARFKQADSVLSQFQAMKWFRPASGLYTDAMIRILHDYDASYRCVLGSVYPFDAAVPWSSFSIQYIKANVTPGSIIILHDGNERGRRTLQTLRNILPYLKQKGYRLVTLSRLSEEAE